MTNYQSKRFKIKNITFNGCRCVFQLLIFKILRVLQSIRSKSFLVIISLQLRRDFSVLKVSSTSLKVFLLPVSDQRQYFYIFQIHDPQTSLCPIITGYIFTSICFIFFICSFFINVHGCLS